MLVSGTDEESDDYAVQDFEIINTMEATEHVCFKSRLPSYVVMYPMS